MGRYHCSEHGIDYNSICPACVRDQAEEDRQSIIDRLSDLADTKSEESDSIRQKLEWLAYKQSNPGEYQCPECLFFSLKKGSSRCPMCHSGVKNEYWERIEKQEKEAAEKKAEQERAAKKAAEEEKRRKEEELWRKKKQEERAVWEAQQEEKRRKDGQVAFFALLLGLLFLLMVVAGLFIAAEELYRDIMGWFS